MQLSHALQRLLSRLVVGANGEDQVRADWPDQCSHIRPTISHPHPLGLENHDPQVILSDLLKCSIVRQKSQ